MSEKETMGDNEKGVVKMAVVPMLSGEAAKAFKRDLATSKIQPYSEKECRETNQRIMSVMERKSKK